MENQIYRFKDLDERGQKAAFKRYASESAQCQRYGVELFAEEVEKEGWTFNEHGERIA